jgi:hypothetical protein
MIDFESKMKWSKILWHLEKVKIKFEAWDLSNGEISIAWTGRKVELHTICINELFKRRLVSIKKDCDEYKAIIIGIGISICHEVAHLLLRWMKIFKTPPIYHNEMGNHFEDRLFACYILFMRQTPRGSSNDWTEHVPIYGFFLVLRF